jgi:two-component system sensor histidine kinase TctE
VTRLRHVVQQLLTLARSEPNTETMARTAPLDLAALAREEVERWTDHAVERGIDLGYEGPDRPVMINGEPSLIRELIGNLLDNAIRYNMRDGKVTLAIEEAPTRLSVEDDGPGIPEGERQRVFERFYRSGDGREEGCGLGLSIAKEIAARHDAGLTLSGVPVGQGTRAEIVFKR